jgi:hypothetical protein
VSMVLGVDKTHSRWGADALELVVDGAKPVAINASLNDGDAENTGFALFDLITPEAVADGGALTIRLRRPKDGAETTISWSGGFANISESPTMGRGSYYVNLTLKG